uniref:Transcription initiation factor TFIID subunit 3 n=1 Tax=Bactrocera dorsalis TaxID=27457 RepID=A0A034W2L5_BACDO
MTDHYIRELLRTVVAQICQTIGYHVVQTTPFELLQDILQRFLHEFSRDLRRQVEHYNRTEACLDDIYITLRNLNINISELLDYTNNVEPVPLAVELPKFPAHKNTNLNFLKPGSKEVLIRPVHIHEYLPPMLPADSKSTLPSHYLHSDSPFFKSSSINCETKTERYLPTFANTVTCMSTPNGLGVSKDSLDPSQEGANITLCSSSHMFDEEGRPTREISSVVMTTGGFISPAIEGKLPDTKVPKFVESSISGTSLEPSLFQASAERNYCNVPPFVPESMKLTSPEVISETRKAERECPKTPKLQHSTTVSEKILNTPELWSTPETSSKSVPPTPGGMSLNTYELHLQNDRATESPKSNADNPVFVGSMYSKHASSSINLAKSSAATSILNAEDPIELSDDSIEYSTIMLNSLSSTNSKDLHQNQLQLPTKSLNFSQIEDYVPIRKDITKELSGDLYLSSKDPKMFQKANKLLKTTKNFLPTEPENLSQIDIFSSEKHGVGKLAGGADLIPLISTGSAYSAKTIPSTSLTATVAAPFTLSKKDIYSTNAFENSLLSANITDNEFLCVSNELQRKKKDHKKLKKLRDDKTKKKKDKKSKCKERTDHHENVVNRNEKSLKEKQKDSLRCDEEQQLVNKDLLKKLKKEKKKKNKQLFTEELVQTVKKHATDTPGISGVGKPTTMFSMFSTSTNLSATTNLSSSTESFVPKLTLKLGNSQSPTPDEDTSHKKYFSTSKTLNEFERKREPSPELARISPLVTRPQKQKFNLAETLISASNQIAVSGGSGNSAFDSINESKVSTVSASKNPCVHSGASSPSPWSSGATLSASSVLLPQQLLRPLKSQEPLLLSSKVDRGLLPNSNINISHSLDVAARHSPVPLISETSRPSSYIDAEGNRVWICPACGKVDDGSPMIGCDGCDAWYHWICVGITIAPKDNEDWFCRVCITRKKGIHATDKKRKRSKKNNTTPN